MVSITYADLNQFTGSERFYRYNGVILTDGTKYLAEQAGCFWLMDIIVSIKPQFKTYDPYNTFWVAQLNVYKEKNNSFAIFNLYDGNDSPPVYTQEIEYTDFPLSEIKLYICQSEIGWVVMLPSEY
jgi:hypothetical protein